MNFFRLGGVTAYGFCVNSDAVPANQAAQAKARRRSEGTITTATVVAAQRGLQTYLATIKAEAEYAQEDALQAALDSGALPSWLSTELKEHVQRSLGQFHDYRTLAGKAQRNLDLYLQKHFPSLTDEELNKKAYELVAAGWALTLMLDKLDAALFLLEPARIRSTVDAGQTRLHGLIQKYVHIYKAEAQDKDVRLVFTGSSHSEIRGNTVAMSAIPHALIDNAVKYAPTGSTVRVEISEDDRHIHLKVTSLGPKIASGERATIFLPYFRGEAARLAEPTGTGFGLAAAKTVASEYGLPLSVHQDTKPQEADAYRTTFTTAFPIARKVTVD